VVRQRTFGPLHVEVPVIGLGTARMERDHRENAIVAIRRGIELGMTHIDTAELYGRGQVEELIGEALAGYRGTVFLASKVRPEHATYAGTLLACENSLRRLRTDRLDLYLLHWKGTLPLGETFRAFETLKNDGKIGAWGVSNFDAADLEQAIEIAGEGAIACNQVLYNLDERDPERGLIELCQRHRVAFVGYSPLGSGNIPQSRARGFSSDVLADIAAAHRVAAPAVALAYLTLRPGTFTIPKSSTLRHVEELASAGALRLSASEVGAIDAAFAR
jgi:diketogulonate reductase-like aldo/keto reductase